MASKCIPDWPPSTSPNLLNHGLEVHLHFHSIMVYSHDYGAFLRSQISDTVQLSFDMKAIWEKEWLLFDAHRIMGTGYLRVRGYEELHKWHRARNVG